MKEKETVPERVEPEYEVHDATWDGIPLTIRHCRSWLSSNAEFQIQHIEVQSAGSVPLPITETGYRSIFLNWAEALTEYHNDPVNYVLSYIRHKAQSKKWKQKVEQDRQPDLFG